MICRAFTVYRKAAVPKKSGAQIKLNTDIITNIRSPLYLHESNARSSKQNIAPAAAPISRYKTVQTIGNTKAGGVYFGSSICRNNSNESVETALKAPHSSIISAPTTAHFLFILQNSEPILKPTFFLIFFEKDIKITSH